jgi:ADP-heptose:LPS heptosyltransferase
MTAPHDYVLSRIDEPVPGSRVAPGAVLSGRGWALGPSPIVSIAVRLGTRLLGYASYGLGRPDVGRSYAALPQAAYSGFVFAVPVPRAVDDLRGADLVLQFRTDAGGEHAHHVPLAWDGAADPATPEGQPPIRLALEECRVGPDRRLTARGYVLAADEPGGLALFINETPLDAPERGLARPDLARRHPDQPNAGHAGFRLVQILDTAPAPTDTLRVVARAGTFVRQVIAPLAPPPASPRLLASGAVTLCCEVLHRDKAGVLHVGGWAVGEAETARVEVLDGDLSLGVAESGLPRPDIGNRFPLFPWARRSGFRLAAATVSAPDAAWGAAPGGTLDGPLGALTLVWRDGTSTERRLALPVPDQEAGGRPIQIVLDTPAATGGQAVAPALPVVMLAGHAVAESGIARVEIWKDDRLLGAAHLGIRREDVAARYPEVPEALTAGFAWAAPSRVLPAGDHALTLRAYARSGAAAETSVHLVLEPCGDGPTPLTRRFVPSSETTLRREVLARSGAPPFVTVLIRRPALDAPHGLSATLESLRRQSLPAWRAHVLCRDETETGLVRRAAGAAGLLDRVAPLRPQGALPWPQGAEERWDLLAVARAGDRLAPQALMELAVAARLECADFAYADEIATDPATGAAAPFLKPGWSPELLLGFNYVGRAWCATRELTERAGLDTTGLAQGGEYDTVLRLTERAARIIHVPRLLAERAGPRIESPDRERKALLRAAERRFGAARVEPGPAPGLWRVRRPAPADPVVSIVMPTRGARGLVRRAIETVRATCAGLAVDLVVLDGTPPEEQGLRAWLDRQADVLIPVQGPFNWSRLNNLGARASVGRFLLFLNDDVEATRIDWLPEMLALAAEPDIGVVGARLLYPDGTVQHAGMGLRGADGVHLFRHAAADAPGPFGLALATRDVTAVTGACLLTRRDVFETLGGFDEAHAIIKNDLDFCLRARARGLRVVLAGGATLTHHELASRAALPDRHDAAAFEGSWAATLALGDTLCNPNLSADNDFWVPEPEPVELIQPGGKLLDRAAVRSVLVVKLDHIGDLLVAFPALSRLRRAFPAARIVLLAATDNAALAMRSGAVDEVIGFDFFAGRAPAGPRDIQPAEYEALAARLCPRQFDIAVDLRAHADTRPILRLSGAAMLAGFDPDGRFPWLDIALAWERDAPLVPKRTHISATLMRLAAAVDAACADGDPPPYRATPEKAGDAPLVCMHAGAGTALKQWPAPNFAALIRLLLDGSALRVVLIGGAEEAAQAEHVLALAGNPPLARSLVGQVPLSDLPELLRQAVLFVGNDSGPKHLAAGLGVPTVAVHAAHVDAAEWGPAGPRAIAVRRRMTCGPCYIAEEQECPRGVVCLRGIEPGQVYRACRLLLGLDLAAGATSGTAAGAAA